ncbi:hypothetical protein K438DRAFT_1956451 [Mycena galopus ATCC 62051]|nr:hypothetical protein K438DRAFT_1956451 [Mycena galopus ATCC 62051]
MLHAADLPKNLRGEAHATWSGWPRQSLSKRMPGHSLPPPPSLSNTLHFSLNSNLGSAAPHSLWVKIWNWNQSRLLLFCVPPHHPVDVEAQAELFSQDLTALRRYQQDLIDILARRLTAREEIDLMAALPTGVQSRVNDNLLMLDSLNLINEELTRRMVARGVRTRTVVGGPLINCSATRGESLLGRDSAPSTPPPSIGSTPLPNYPGTPESSADSSSVELWSVQDDPGSRPPRGHY